METVLVGYISEAWVSEDPPKNRLMHRWNRNAISQLPEPDTWPPLNRTMFAYSGLDPLRGGYRGSVIHFGGRYKSIEQEWDEWLLKYETLLSRLYWGSSTVYLETELSGSYRFEWWTDTESFQGFLDPTPRLPNTWEFRGPFRRWPDA